MLKVILSVCVLTLCLTKEISKEDFHSVMEAIDYANKTGDWDAVYETYDNLHPRTPVPPPAPTGFGSLREALEYGERLNEKLEKEKLRLERTEPL